MTEDVTYLPPTSELRAWADDPTANGVVPVFPATLRAIADELDSVRASYNELLFSVGNKWPNETRHETARRYIEQAEAAAERAALTVSDE